ncbi:MAG: VanW family protein, partial [Abditibacteriaceae bacterium]
ENIDGTIVPNGSIFSANKAIGERNAKNGWKMAKMFVNGDVVDGIGSGICQCATTLYNAALLAGLPIVERHQHQFRVFYAPTSRDATLYWGQKDFKFRNNTGGPIYVQAFVHARHYIVRLYGTSSMTKDIKVESKVLSRKDGGERSEAFRIIDGKRELLSRDSYLPEPKKDH